MATRSYRLIQKGWEGYTGDIGQMAFVDGVATGDYPLAYIDRVASSFQLVDAETDEPVGPAQRALLSRAAPAPVAEPLNQMTPEQIAAANAAAAAAAAKTLHPTRVYTYEDLEVVIDAKGMAGLREIAQPFGVKAKSIPDLMKAILTAQDVVLKAHPYPHPEAAHTVIVPPAQGSETPVDTADPTHVVERNG